MKFFTQFKMSKHDDIKSVLYKFLQKNPNMEKSEAVQRFEAIGYNKRNLYRWIKLIEQNGAIKSKLNKKKRAKKANKANLTKIKNFFDHRSGCSQNKIARRLGCSQSYICKILKKYTNIRCYKKIKKPLLTEEQKKSLRPKCRKMLERFRDLDFIIDDESYFTLRNTSLSGNDRFYSSNLNNTADKAKFNFKSKYEPKLLVWLAICPKGMSKPFFVPSGLAVNKEVYLENCIKARLEPFIKNNYKEDEYVFWPDLASSHYAIKVQAYLRTQNINYVPKSINPANCPKARPIEDYWGNLKQEEYKNDWAAKNLIDLRKRILSCLRKTDTKLVQDHASAVKQRLDSIRRYGY